MKPKHLALLMAFAWSPAGGQNINEWLEEQLNASAAVRHVDYEEMYAKAIQDDKGVDPLIKCLVMVDYCRAYGLDSLMVEMADFVLEKATNEQIGNGIAAYLLDIKYRLYVLKSLYAEMEKMACYVDKRRYESPTLKARAARWHRLAEAGKDIQPVSISRKSNEVKLKPEHDEDGHMCISVNVNQERGCRFILDTGNMSSSILFRDFATRTGVKLLPDTTKGCSASNPDVVYNMQLGIVDSLEIEGITLYNLPVWVSDEPNQYGCNGFIGTPDLVRLEYMELSRDSVIFRHPLPSKKQKANFTMNAGIRGERCICLPCTLDGHKSSLIFDTGSDIFLFPPQYANRKEGFYAEVGGQTMWIGAGMYAHGFVPHADSRGFWGQPLLWSFERLCINFRDAHIDYVRKKDAKIVEYLH